jgi:hypothetical protein
MAFSWPWGCWLSWFQRVWAQEQVLAEPLMWEVAVMEQLNADPSQGWFS